MTKPKRASIVWVDDLGRGRALIWNGGNRPVTGPDLTTAFQKVRAQGAIVDAKHPMTVFGTHTTCMETPTWKFVQGFESEILALLSALRGEALPNDV